MSAGRPTPAVDRNEIRNRIRFVLCDLPRVERLQILIELLSELGISLRVVRRRLEIATSDPSH